MVPNARAYRQGWDSGIQRFCTAANGWREGVAGHSGKAAVYVGQAGYAGFNLDAGLQVYLPPGAYSAQHPGKQPPAEETRRGAGTDERQIRRQLQDIDRDQFYLHATSWVSSSCWHREGAHHRCDQQFLRSLMAAGHHSGRRSSARSGWLPTHVGVPAEPASPGQCQHL